MVGEDVSRFFGVAVLTVEITQLKRGDVDVFQARDYLSLVLSLCSVFFLHQ